MEEVCLICNEVFTEDSHFWKKHKIKIADYYAQYFNKIDLHTGEPIKFKSREQYLLNDFVNRRNLANYLESIDNLDEKQDFCKDLLIRRKEIKENKYTLTQVELRSLILPTMLTYEKIFINGYYKLCEEIGYKNKFNKVLKKQLESDPTYKDKNYHIVIDTREQTPFRFDFPIQVDTLNFGDYGFSVPNKAGNIYVERKNISDFISTLSSGYERFQKEIERSKDNGAYLVVVVESGISYALSFDYSKWLSRFVKASPDFIFHRVRELLQKYDNLQFAFIDGPTNAAKLTQLLLTSNGVAKEIDIQYHLDTNKLIF
jgi:hypothetical protein